MKVCGQGQSLNADHAYGLQRRTEKHEQRAELDPERVETRAYREAGDCYEQRGVIRNLLEGHYKGVADLRLRINFHEELASLQSSSAQEALQAQAPALEEFKQALDGLAEGLPQEAQALAGTLSGEIDQLLASPPATVEETQAAVAALRERFASLVALLTAPPAEEIPPQDPAPEDALQEVLGEILAEETSADEMPAGTAQAGDAPEESPAPAEDLAGETVSGPAEEIPGGQTLTAEEAAPAPEDPDAALVSAPESGQEQAPALAEAPLAEAGEPEADPADPAQVIASFLETWQVSFGQILDNLESGLSGAAALLPPLAGPPHGHGGAYAKFLAMYESLTGAGAREGGEAASGSIDVTA